MLQIVDAQWKDHLYSLDHLKEGIGLRGYGQRDPLVEYKKESFTLFQAMKDRIDEEMVRYLWRLRPVMSARAARRAPAPVRRPPRRPPALTLQRRLVERRDVRPAARRGGRRAAAPARTGGDDAPVKTGAARRAEDRPQRSVLVRQRQEIQEVSRSVSAGRQATVGVHDD